MFLYQEYFVTRLCFYNYFIHIPYLLPLYYLWGLGWWTEILFLGTTIQKTKVREGWRGGRCPPHGERTQCLNSTGTKRKTVFIQRDCHKTNRDVHKKNLYVRSRRDLVHGSAPKRSDTTYMDIEMIYSYATKGLPNTIK